MPFFDPQFWTGAGAGGVTGALALVTARFTNRTSRLAKLEAEVEECRKRDSRVLVVEACFRVVMPELVRKDPGNQALTLVGDLLKRSAPIDPTAALPAEWMVLIDQLPKESTSGPA